MKIAEIENEIVEEFELFGDDWEGKYEHLIDLLESFKVGRLESSLTNQYLNFSTLKLFNFTTNSILTF